MKLILENWRKFIKEAQWADSYDSDWPAMHMQGAKDLRSAGLVTFDSEDAYYTQGQTHGLDSHALKHYAEFYPDQVEEMANAMLSFVKNLEQDLYYLHPDEGPEAIGASGDLEVTTQTDVQGGLFVSKPDVSDPKGSELRGTITLKDLTPGDMINTSDFINDKKLTGKKLLPIEDDIYDRFVKPLALKYDALVNPMLRNAIDISNAVVGTRENLISILSKRPVIKFKAVYTGYNEESFEKFYLVNTKNSVMASLSGGKVNTLYNQMKKPPEQIVTLRQAIKAFATGKGTVPTDEYSIFRDYVNEILAPQSQPKKKQKQPQQKKRPNIKAMVQGMARGGKTAEEIQAQIEKSTGKTIDVSNIAKMIGS